MTALRLSLAGGSDSAILHGVLTWTWITSAALTASLTVLNLVGSSQSGECYDGDPLPNCPNASTLWELGYVIAALTLLCGAVCLVATVMILWRVRRKQPLRG